MSDRVTSTRVTSARPVVHYIPVSEAALAELNRRALAQRRDADLYARWVQRQAEYRAREARTRRIALRVVAGFVAVLFVVVGVATWRAVQFLEGHPTVMLGGLSLLALVAVLVVGGGATTVVVVVRVRR